MNGLPFHSLGLAALLLSALAPVAEALAAQAGVEPPSGARGGYGASAASDAASRGEAPTSVANSFVLSAAYPNPAADRAALVLTLNAAADATVVVYDVLGRRVAVLHEGPLATGTHELAIGGEALPVGVYLVHVESGSDRLTQRITVLR